MSEENRIVLSTGDFFLLDSARHSGQRENLPELSRKLDVAIVTFPADVPVDTVMTGRAVMYRLGQEPSAERMISSNPAGPTEIALLSPLGLALVGLSAGQSVVVQLEPGVETVLTVERVSEPAAGFVVAAGSSETGSRVLAFQPRKPVRPSVGGLDDDPGPSAA